MPAYQGPTYAEYLMACKAAEDTLSESLRLRRRVAELEDRLQAVELTPERTCDLGNSDLTQLAAHYHTLLEAIVDELRARHHDVSVDLIAPQIRALERERDEAKERAWQARSEAHELQQENARLMAALEKLADVADVRPEHEQIPQRGGKA
jgi:DNA anti-recombination protein RmuC